MIVSLRLLRLRLRRHFWLQIVIPLLIQSPIHRKISLLLISRRLRGYISMVQKVFGRCLSGQRLESIHTLCGVDHQSLMWLKLFYRVFRVQLHIDTLEKRSFSFDEFRLCLLIDPLKDLIFCLSILLLRPSSIHKILLFHIFYS